MDKQHYASRIGWLRAAVLGANDGIVSTASLLIGVAAAGASHDSIMLAGLAGLVAGAMSMAAGEYVSVSSQADTERADLAREREHLAADEEYERRELADIYVNRGLEPALAREVAIQLMEHDALAAHARDELGLTQTHRARPFQAAWASATTFAIGAGLPLLIASLSTTAVLIPLVAGGSLPCLALLGLMGARAGGANMTIAALRVTLWGGLAMVATAAVGIAFG